MKTSELLMWCAIVGGLVFTFLGVLFDALRKSVPIWIFIAIALMIILQVIFAIKAGKGGKK